MTMHRRLVVAAGATLASGLAWRKPRAAAAAEGDAPPAAPSPAPGPAPNGDLPGKPLPDVRWQEPDGTVHTIADYAGKAVVLNLWATWCVPCVAEMPALDSLAAAVGASGVVVLPVSSDRGGAAAVERFYAARSITHLPVMLDPTGAAARALGARGIPTTLLIDPHGRERARLEGGADWASPQSIAMVKALLTA